jgi:hypothetical protein
LPEGTATCSTSETIPAKPRRPRKKKTTAFTTGAEMLPPSTETDIQPD